MYARTRIFWGEDYTALCIHLRVDLCSIAKLPKEYLLFYAESVQFTAASVRSRQYRDLTIPLGNAVAKLRIAHVSVESTLELIGKMMFDPESHHSYDAA